MVFGGLTLKVARIWRYPVKSMRGEQLDHARIDTLGIEGDRIVHVRDGRGRVITARTHPQLLGHSATLDSAGELRIDGRQWQEPSVLADIAKIVGPGAQFVRDESSNRFDVLPLLVATDGSIRALGEDGRRLRPNLVIAGVEGLGERSWPGNYLEIEEAIIEVVDLRQRCVMTTFHPDTLVQDSGVLTKIVKRFGGMLALNCAVARSGSIRVGSHVKLRRANSEY